MSFGVPVVATTIGCEGLAVEDDREVLIADTPETFAEACLRLLEDRKLGERLAAAARDFLATHHSQECVNGVIADVVGAMTPSVCPCQAGPPA
jgi:glycosyltransferase involved in cell wall biosynthesis